VTWRDRQKESLYIVCFQKGISIAILPIAALTSGSGQISRDTDPSIATVGYATPDRHKAAATIATDASTRITTRTEWYWSHLLRSLFQSPGSAFKSQAATRLLIGTRQISENGTVTASKAADDKHAPKTNCR
jgi:hypothetical protein